MDKQKITADIISFLKCKGQESHWINKSELGEYLGLCKAKVTSFMEGVEYLNDGKQHKFFASDVAQRIYERRQS